MHTTNSGIHFFSNENAHFPLFFFFTTMGYPLKSKWKNVLLIYGNVLSSGFHKVTEECVLYVPVILFLTTPFLWFHRTLVYDNLCKTLDTVLICEFL